MTSQPQHNELTEIIRSQSCYYTSELVGPDPTSPTALTCNISAVATPVCLRTAEPELRWRPAAWRRVAACRAGCWQVSQPGRPSRRMGCRCPLDQGASDEGVCGRSHGSDRQAAGAAAGRGRGGRGADDRASRRLQRQGQARAGLAPGAAGLAAGVHGGMTDRERLLDELRPVAFAIAYRMLGSGAEAEDVVQEALLRVHQALDGGEQIASPRAFVATVTTRLAINELRSARVRREHYVGEWLPEPIITDGHDDPAQQAEMADSLSLAMLVLLESLSPEQRAVLLLHDVFDYPFSEIEALLASDVVLTGDGSGKVPALARSLHGRNRVALAVVNWVRRVTRIPGGSLRVVEVNGGPGALYLDAQQ